MTAPGLITGVIAVIVIVLTAACTTTAPPTSAPAASATAVSVPASADPNRSAGTSPRTAASRVPPPGTQPARSGVSDTKYPELGTTDLDVVDYDLALDYDVENRQLRGRAAITANALVSLDRVSLDFQGLQVDRVTVGDNETTSTVEGRKLLIDLPQATAPGSSMKITVTYHGTPKPVATDALNGVEVGWHSSPKGSFVLAEPEGASTWFPVNNHPRDKATYRFAVTVAKPYKAIANGTLDATDDMGSSRTFRWSMPDPMASYLATVVTGDFEEQAKGSRDGVTYSDWYPIGSAPPPASSQEAVQTLSEWLGPFPFSTYGAVVYPRSFIQGSPRTQKFLSGVALESQGRSLYAEQAATRNTVIHETAHQWMGDSVSLTDWSRDIWWVEGFARFAESIGDGDADRAAEFETQFAEVKRKWIPPGALDRDALFSYGAYTEGAIVFYALQREVGLTNFKRILRTFADRYRHANASTDDLIAVAGEVAGRDLRSFFQAWLYAPAPPTSIPK